jgi:hypothetical protein
MGYTISTFLGDSDVCKQNKLGNVRTASQFWHQPLEVVSDRSRFEAHNPERKVIRPVISCPNVQVHKKRTPPTPPFSIQYRYASFNDGDTFWEMSR